jgi:hypothetical protein
MSELLRNLVEAAHTESAIAMPHVQRVCAWYDNSDHVEPELGDIGSGKFDGERFETGGTGVFYQLSKLFGRRTGGEIRLIAEIDLMSGGPGKFGKRLGILRTIEPQVIALVLHERMSPIQFDGQGWRVAKKLPGIHSRVCEFVERFQ